MQVDACCVDGLCEVRHLHLVGYGAVGAPVAAHASAVPYVNPNGFQGNLCIFAVVLAAVAADGGVLGLRQPSRGVASYHKCVLAGGILRAHEREHLLQPFFRGRGEVLCPALDEFGRLKSAVQFVDPWRLGVVDEEQQAVVGRDVGHGVGDFRAVVGVVTAVSERVLHAHVHHHHAPVLFLGGWRRVIVVGAGDVQGNEQDAQQIQCE